MFSNFCIFWKFWLEDWCSYHGAFVASPSGLVVQYAVVGNPATAPGNSGQVCTPVGSGRLTANGDLGADSMAVGYAQQLAQTITGLSLFLLIHTTYRIILCIITCYCLFTRLWRVRMVFGPEWTGGGQRLRGKLWAPFRHSQEQFQHSTGKQEFPRTISLETRVRLHHAVIKVLAEPNITS